MEGELHQLARQIAALDRSVERLAGVLVQMSIKQQVVLAKLGQVLELLEPATTFPASIGGTITVK